MSGLRPWLLLLAGTCFLTGVAAGVLVARRLAPPPPEEGAFADYRAMLVQRFELSEDRALGLRLILDRYHQEIEDLKTRQLEAADEELVRIGRRYEDWIRERVLPPEQRAEYDRLAVGFAAAGTTHAPER
jgi:hypothetical protein